ncbi:MAG: urease accessory protein UreH domain-containing protein [Eubacteriales bacterium]
MYDWYFYLGKLSAQLKEPITHLSGQLNVPIITAFLLGILGSTSPCQLSTNTGAVALITKDGFNKKRYLVSAGSYVLGKITMYSVIGGVIILMGLNVRNLPIPIVVLVRKLSGPILVITGLYLLGLFSFSLPEIVKIDSLNKIFTKQGNFITGFGMGGFFSLAFCPTLYLLFFGITLPLSIKTPGGIFFPGIFAIGTSLPLILFVIVFTIGSDLLASKFMAKMKRANKYMKIIAGFIFIISGIIDILLYFSYS